jgi:superfamily II DNA or RNA helicase
MVRVCLCARHALCATPAPPPSPHNAGKSATIFELCCQLGRKVLYVVSERENMDQTRDNLLGTPTVYGWVPRARVGSLRESWDAAQRARPGTKAAAKCDWEHKDFVIASTKSLLECGYPQHVLDSFGTWVFDEADVAAADTVRHLASLVPARYVLGVSATPHRRDGLQHVIHWLLGPATFVYKRLAWVTGRQGTVRVLQVSDWRL